mmetsp:Transcript_18297/g.50437  ORF Transcript_18297/g.50437 Transcript_18297/m.50437 type:complete len:259 (-) Transcript_18297:2848-3624(-)
MDEHQNLRRQTDDGLLDGQLGVALRRLDPSLLRVALVALLLELGREVRLDHGEADREQRRSDENHREGQARLQHDVVVEGELEGLDEAGEHARDVQAEEPGLGIVLLKLVGFVHIVARGHRRCDDEVGGEHLERRRVEKPDEDGTESEADRADNDDDHRPHAEGEVVLVGGGALDAVGGRVHAVPANALPAEHAEVQRGAARDAHAEGVSTAPQCRLALCADGGVAKDVAAGLRAVSAHAVRRNLVLDDVAPRATTVD